jgi:hypothetical protein
MRVVKSVDSRTKEKLMAVMDFFIILPLSPQKVHAMTIFVVPKTPPVLMNSVPSNSQWIVHEGGNKALRVFLSSFLSTFENSTKTNILKSEQGYLWLFTLDLLWACGYTT